jgi:hypothetical protein
VPTMLRVFITSAAFKIPIIPFKKKNTQTSIVPFISFIVQLVFFYWIIDFGPWHWTVFLLLDLIQSFKVKDFLGSNSTGRESLLQQIAQACRSNVRDLMWLGTFFISFS